MNPADNESASRTMLEGHFSSLACFKGGLASDTEVEQHGEQVGIVDHTVSVHILG